MAALRIGICGGGVRGLSAAIGLRELGHDPVVFEQAPEFLRIGADVNLTPNAVHALDRLGVGDVLRKTAARPTFRISRMWDTGEETSRLPMSDAAEEKYGAPQLTIHRADLLKALEAEIPEDGIRLGKMVSGIVNDGSRTAVEFADVGAMCRLRRSTSQFAPPVRKCQVVRFAVEAIDGLQPFPHRVARPRITWGRFTEVHKRVIMPLSVQVHHGLADGYHVGRFFELFQQWVESVDLTRTSPQESD